MRLVRPALGTRQGHAQTTWPAGPDIRPRQCALCRGWCVGGWSL